MVMRARPRNARSVSWWAAVSLRRRLPSQASMLPPTSSDLPDGRARAQVGRRRRAWRRCSRTQSSGGSHAAPVTSMTDTLPRGSRNPPCSDRHSRDPPEHGGTEDVGRIDLAGPRLFAHHLGSAASRFLGRAAQGGETVWRGIGSLPVIRVRRFGLARVPGGARRSGTARGRGLWSALRAARPGQRAGR